MYLSGRQLPSSSMLLSCATSIKFFPISASTQCSSPLGSMYVILIVCFAMTPPSSPVVEEKRRRTSTEAADALIVVANLLRVGICCNLPKATELNVDKGRRRIEAIVFACCLKCYPESTAKHFHDHCLPHDYPCCVGEIEAKEDRRVGASTIIVSYRR